MEIKNILCFTETRRDLLTASHLRGHISLLSLPYAFMGLTQYVPLSCKPLMLRCHCVSVCAYTQGELRCCNWRPSGCLHCHLGWYQPGSLWKILKLLIHVQCFMARQGSQKVLPRAVLTPECSAICLALFCDVKTLHLMLFYYDGTIPTTNGRCLLPEKVN